MTQYVVYMRPHSDEPLPYPPILQYAPYYDTELMRENFGDVVSLKPDGVMATGQLYEVSRDTAVNLLKRSVSCLHVSHRDELIKVIYGMEDAMYENYQFFMRISEKLDDEEANQIDWTDFAKMKSEPMPFEISKRRFFFTVAVAFVVGGLVMGMFLG